MTEEEYENLKTYGHDLLARIEKRELEVLGADETWRTLIRAYDLCWQSLQRHRPTLSYGQIDPFDGGPNED